MTTISFRTDPETDRALADLVSEGIDRSEAIRRAVVAESRRVRRERLRAEAERLAADPSYRAEVAAIREESEGLRAW